MSLHAWPDPVTEAMAKTRTRDTILNISDLPSDIEEDYIQYHFVKKLKSIKCSGAAEVKVLNFSEADNTAVVSIKQLDSTGMYIVYSSM